MLVPERESPPPKPPPKKLRLTVHLPAELIERIKNAVFWTPGLARAELAELRIRIVCNHDSADIGPEEWSAIATAVAQDIERVSVTRSGKGGSG